MLGNFHVTSCNHVTIGPCRLQAVVKLYSKWDLFFINSYGTSLGYTVRTQLVGLLYRKLLRLNSVGDKVNTPGKVLNIINNDLRRIDDIFAVVALALQFPIFLGGTVFQVYTRLGMYPVLLGV